MQFLPLSAVRLDDACQPRAVTDLNLAGEYAEAMLANGAVFPPVVVFHDGESYWLADGYHRWHACQVAQIGTIECDVRVGGRREAILHSVGANSEHGWRRSNEDKRKGVLTLLRDSEWGQWSDREIARRCGVDGKTVAGLRPRPSAELPQIPPKRKVERNGTVFEQSTANINASRPSRAEEQQGMQDAEEAWQGMQAEASPAPGFVYDSAAGFLRLRIGEVVERLSDDAWPTPAEAIEAWMKGRGDEVTPAQMQAAAQWLSEFAALFYEAEPRRLALVHDMLNRAKEMVDGPH